MSPRRHLKKGLRVLSYLTAHSGDPFDAEGFAVKERDARTALYDILDIFDFNDVAWEELGAALAAVHIDQNDDGRDT